MTTTPGHQGQFVIDAAINTNQTSWRTAVANRENLQAKLILADQEIHRCATRDKELRIAKAVLEEVMPNLINPNDDGADDTELHYEDVAEQLAPHPLPNEPQPQYVVRVVEQPKETRP